MNIIDYKIVEVLKHWSLLVMLKYGTEQNNHETIDELEETQRSQEQNLIINTTKSSWRKLVVLSTCDCFVWKNFLLPGWDILIIDRQRCWIKLFDVIIDRPWELQVMV